MKTISFSKTIAALAGLALLAVTATRADAIIIINSSYGFVGLTAGQTMRLAVAHAVDPNNPNFDPCIVEWSFFDLAGAVVASGEARLEPGTAALDDLRAAELGGPDTRPGDRFEIRAEIKASGSDRNAKFCQNNLRPTLQVFDEETGRTTLVVSPVSIKGIAWGGPTVPAPNR